MNHPDSFDWVPIIFAILGSLLTVVAYIYPGEAVGKQGVFNIAMILVSSAAGAYGAKKLQKPDNLIPPNSNTTKEQ